MLRVSLTLLAAFGLVAVQSGALPTRASLPPQRHVTYASPRSIRAAALQQRQEHAERSLYTYPASLQQRYRNNEHGFLVRYPQGWKAQEMKQENYGKLSSIILFLSPLEGEKDVSRENINLVVEELAPSPQTLEGYTAAAIALEQELFDEYTLTASHDLQIAGLSAHRITYTAAVNGGSTTAFEQIWFIRDGKAYVWSLAALPESYDRYAQTFRLMLDSLSFRM